MSEQGTLAFVLEGGGARAAWQVGALKGLVGELPELAPRIQVGVSAGAINATQLANFQGDLPAALLDLERTWRALDVQGVFRTQPGNLVLRLLRVGLRLALGLKSPGRPILGMVETGPLRATLRRGLCDRHGCMRGVTQNLASGRLQALALITTRYATGQTICFFQGGDVSGWERPNRRGIKAELSVEHVMASSALPLFFPPIQIDGDWYGDGGVRLVAPLAPAIHLGADRILALSTRYARSLAEAELGARSSPPTPALIAGNLFNAIFLDSLDQDAAHLERVNHLVAALPKDAREDLRPVRLSLLRPSVDLGRMASRFEPDLPFLFRHLLRNLGTGHEDSQDLVSTVLFEPRYIEALLQIGEQDGRAAAERVRAELAL